MKTQTITGRIVDIKRARNSVNGNPNYTFKLVTPNGNVIPVGTLNDYMVNYEFGNHFEGKRQVTITVKVNRYSNKLLSIESNGYRPE